LKRAPQHRFITTEDVAATLVALSQPEIKFISGSVIFVDGGESIMLC
jgi:enoyl-[acyl-carrier-protein] reductase (NADH)